MHSVVVGLRYSWCYMCVWTEPETSFSCDPGEKVSDEITKQKGYMESMRDTVSQLNDILTALVSRQYSLVFVVVQTKLD